MGVRCAWEPPLRVVGIVMAIARSAAKGAAGVPAPVTANSGAVSAATLAISMLALKPRARRCRIRDPGHVGDSAATG